MGFTIVLRELSATLPSSCCPVRYRVESLLLMMMPTRSTITLAAIIAAALALPAGATAAPEVRPGQLIVGYDQTTSAGQQDRIATQAGTNPGRQISPTSQVVKLEPGESTAAALKRLRASDGVSYAVRNVVAHASAWLPNDSINSGPWSHTQWNFLSKSGIDALGAWRNLIAAHRTAGAGVKIAVVDTGVAYRDWGNFRRSPDFKGTSFAAPHDFVANNAYPLDRAGHGTHVAGTIGEQTNNGIWLTGIAYKATIIPVRVLDANGEGDSAQIALGIRWAANHGAKIINLSLEFTPDTIAADIPDIISAIDYATKKGSLVVAAAGNDRARAASYPARATNAIAVGATTEHRCLADYSNYGRGIDIVAPGGGSDRNLPSDAHCRPNDAPGGDITQVSLATVGMTSTISTKRFILDSQDGTSMAAPHVSATAALVVASGVIGSNPTPAQLRSRLLRSADPMGTSNMTLSHRRDYYGAGLLDAARATSRSFR